MGYIAKSSAGSLERRRGRGTVENRGAEKVLGHSGPGSKSGILNIVGCARGANKNERKEDSPH